jgi:hypothetical protein
MPVPVVPTSTSKPKIDNQRMKRFMPRQWFECHARRATKGELAVKEV